MPALTQKNHLARKLAKQRELPAQVIQLSDKAIVEVARQIAMTLADESAPIGTIAAIHHTLNNYWIKALEHNRDAAKWRLTKMLDDAKDAEIQVEFADERYKIVLSRPKSRLPDVAKLTALLESKGYRMEHACSAEIKYVPDTLKLSKLVNDGAITEAELEECRVEKTSNGRLTVEKV